MMTVNVSQVSKIVTEKGPLYKEILKEMATTIVINTMRKSDHTTRQTLQEMAVKIRRLRRVTKTKTCPDTIMSSGRALCSIGHPEEFQSLPRDIKM